MQPEQASRVGGCGEFRIPRWHLRKSHHLICGVAFVRRLERVREGDGNDGLLCTIEFLLPRRLHCDDGKLQVLRGGGLQFGRVWPSNKLRKQKSWLRKDTANFLNRVPTHAAGAQSVRSGEGH